MNIIKRVIINGFWSDRRVQIDFKEDVNFFYGSNGSGKTTILNIIASILSCDYLALCKLPFSDAEIQFHPRNQKEISIINVTKNQESGFLTSIDDSNIKIDYVITQKLPEDKIDFSLTNRRPRISSSDFFKKYNNQHQGRNYISQFIADSIWLTVSRSSYSGDREIDESSKEKFNPIDQKISQVTTELAKYFSSLDSASNTEWKKLQAEIFLSLIQTNSNLQIEEKLSKINLSQENQHIDNVLKKAGLEKREYSTKTKSFYSKLKPTIENFTKDGILSIEDFSLMLNAVKLNSIATSWAELQEKQKKIYEKKDLFKETINNLFSGKSIEIIETNEIQLRSSSGKDLSIYDLSSGEKQLLIILGQALTKQSSEWIYIADEPELSLHIDWQENLVKNILAISPNVQIVFATHSPDIVDSYSKNAIDVQKSIKKVKNVSNQE